jgi:endonuclease YncB( thermonuclease family)
MLRNAALLWIVVVVLAGGAVSDTAARRTAAPSTSARVARVIDGDTIVLADGVRVRLVQIDTPEVGTGECFSRAAGRELRAMLPAGAAVTLVADPRLDRVDRYGRLLRYVLRDGRNVNLELVRRGAATVWLYDGDRGRYAAQLLAVATAARRARLGLWGACPRAVWNPFAAASTGPGSPARTTQRGRSQAPGPAIPRTRRCVSLHRRPISTAATSPTATFPSDRPISTTSTARATAWAARAPRGHRASTRPLTAARCAQRP